MTSGGSGRRAGIILAGLLLVLVLGSCGPSTTSFPPAAPQPSATPQVDSSAPIPTEGQAPDVPAYAGTGGQATAPLPGQGTPAQEDLGSAALTASDVQRALAERILGDPEALCEWETWGQAGQKAYLWAVCESASGSAASVPAAVRLGADGQIEGVDLPRDGDLYAPDVRQIFPPDVQDRIFAQQFDAGAALARIAERRNSMGRKGTGPDDPGLTLYVSQTLQVLVRIPTSWQAVPGYDQRYGGPDGFVQVAAISGEDTPLDQVCRQEALHVLQPYGSQPVIQSLELQGQQSCLVLPSADQPAEMQGQAALIARYPQPIQVDGQTYHYLVLWADQDHVRDLAETVRFLPSSSAETMTVTFFFANEQLNPGQADCGLVFPVTRIMPASPAVAEAALAELFGGPTEAERQQGYVSLFSPATRFILKSLKIEGQTAYLDLADVREIIPSASSSCGSQSFLAQVETTLRAVLPIERLIYAIDGDPAPFYEWLQFGCDQSNDYCDKTPFAEP